MPGSSAPDAAGRRQARARRTARRKAACHPWIRRQCRSYFLRDMSLASLELLAGCALVLFGAVFGLYHWGLSVSTGAPASTGTVMLAALPLLVGLQLLLAFLAYDIASVPRKVLSSRLGRRLRGH